MQQDWSQHYPYYVFKAVNATHVIGLRKKGYCVTLVGHDFVARFAEYRSERLNETVGLDGKNCFDNATGTYCSCNGESRCNGEDKSLNGSAGHTEAPPTSVTPPTSVNSPIRTDASTNKITATTRPTTTTKKAIPKTTKKTSAGLILRFDGIALVLHLALALIL